MMDTGQAVSEKMQCMEIWGGNKSTWSQFSLPGLDVWVYSEPYLSEVGGGDVYYLSSCASGRISRMLLADVSGHGTSVAPVAQALRDLMRRNINFVKQTQLVASLNSQFESISKNGCFATAVVSTFFSPTRTLSVCNAGHPVPLFRNGHTGRWTFDEVGLGESTPRNLPIGIIDGVGYQSIKRKLNVNDMVLTYTDSLSEAVDANGKLLGTQGVCDIINRFSSLAPDRLIPSLLEEIRAMNSENLKADDTTVMLLRANGSGARFIDSLKAPLRILRGLWSAR